MARRATTNAADMLFSEDEHIHLDADSPIPLYHQLEQILLDRITRQSSTNAIVPPEEALIEIFGVSRVTVRKALENLVNQGLIERRRGLGTRVIQSKLTEDLARLKSYTEEMGLKHASISSKVLFAGEITPDPYVQHKLRLADGEKTLCVRRLRGAEDVFPIVLLRSEIPASLGIKPDEDFTGSLYDLFEKRYGISIVYADQAIEAAKASADEARRLGVKAGSPVLVMERLTFTRGDRPIEWIRGVYRCDRYKYSIRLKR